MNRVRSCHLIFYPHLKFLWRFECLPEIGAFLIWFLSWPQYREWKSTFAWNRNREGCKSKTNCFIGKLSLFVSFLSLPTSIFSRLHILSWYLIWPVFPEAFSMSHSRFTSFDCSSFSYQRLASWDPVLFYRVHFGLPP